LENTTTMRRFLLALTITLFGVSARTEAGIIMTIEAPGVTTSQVAGVSTETFDGFTTGPHALLPNSVGFYTATPTGTAPVINPASFFGGAGGVGNFLQADGGVRFTPVASLGYFGFWWSAANSGDTVTVNGVTTFDLDTILNSGLLQPGYYGNPSGFFQGHDPQQPFVYVNLFATDISSKFLTIDFSGPGFQTDNHSTLHDVVTPTGTVVPAPVSAPEPASLTMLGLGAFSVLGYAWRWKKAGRAAS
jgi:hypothetical protein